MMILHAPRSILEKKKNKINKNNNNAVILSSQNLISDPQSEKNEGKQAGGYDTKASGCLSPLSPPLAPSSALHQALLFLCCPSCDTHGELRVRRVEDDGARWGNVMLFFFFVSFFKFLIHHECPWRLDSSRLVECTHLSSFRNFCKYRLSIFFLFRFVFEVEEEERIQNV